MYIRFQSPLIIRLTFRVVYLFPILIHSGSHSLFFSFVYSLQNYNLSLNIITYMCDTLFSFLLLIGIVRALLSTTSSSIKWNVSLVEHKRIGHLLGLRSIQIAVQSAALLSLLFFLFFLVNSFLLLSFCWSSFSKLKTVSSSATGSHVFP